MEDVLPVIFSYLDVKSLCRVRQVCLQWKRAGEHKTLWKQIYINVYGKPLREDLPLLEYESLAKQNESFSRVNQGGNFAHTQSVYTLTPWGDWMCSNTYGKVKVWNEKGKQLFKFRSRSDNISPIVVWNDWLCHEGPMETILVWNKSGNKVFSLRGHDDEIYAFCIWNEFLCSGSRDRTVRLWDKMGREVGILTGHTGAVSRLIDWSGWLCAAAENGMLLIWEKNRRCVHRIKAHRDFITCMAVWDDWLCTSSWDDTVRVWNRSGQCVMTIPIPDPVSIVVWNSSLCVASMGSDTVRLFDRCGTPFKTLTGAKKSLVSLTVANSPKSKRWRHSRLFGGSETDNTICLWNLWNGSSASPLISPRIPRGSPRLAAMAHIVSPLMSPRS